MVFDHSGTKIRNFHHHGGAITHGVAACPASGQIFSVSILKYFGRSQVVRISHLVNRPVNATAAHRDKRSRLAPVDVGLYLEEMGSMEIDKDDSSPIKLLLFHDHCLYATRGNRVSVWRYNQAL